MPTRSGSFTSRRKACAKRWSSKRRPIIVQSSMPKFKYNGSELPTSFTSFTPKTSDRSEASVLSAPAFAAATVAFFASVALKVVCFPRHAFWTFCHSFQAVLNHSEGTISSTRAFRFLSCIQSLMYCLHFASFDHSNLISSKPSLFSGQENLWKAMLNTNWVRSVTGLLLKTSLFSASVRLTEGGSSSMGSDSSATSSCSSSGSAFSSSGAFSPLASASVFFF
mmetsp:Transcript_70113/g.113082  ORF Transcript_70113/g.113082 Transcript_70113/m.113082 type:complete len:223 (-) Transcript_70113:901-1569(-)